MVIFGFFVLQSIYLLLRHFSLDQNGGLSDFGIQGYAASITENIPCISGEVVQIPCQFFSFRRALVAIFRT